MKRKIYPLIFMIVVFSTTGCVKDTYDMNKLSKKMHLSPTLAVSAIKGVVSLSDMVKSSDTVVYDQNKFVNIVFKKDSVVNLKLSDFYDFSNMLAFTQSYTLGDLSIDPFTTFISVTLGQISSGFSPALMAQFAALDNGSTHPFPSFPSVNLGEKTFTGISNFETAVFQSGFLDITVKNNLTAPLSSLNVNLFNTSGHSAIGGTITIPAIPPGQTETVPFDLSDKTVTNSIIAAIVLSGSPGNGSPVLISLNNSNIQVTISGRALKVKSGRVKLPQQTITSLDNLDTLNFNLGNGIELVKIQTTTANISYHIQSSVAAQASITLTMPTAKTGGNPVTKQIDITGGGLVDGTIPFNNALVDLSTIVQQPYNQLPVTYGISVNSNNTIINFNSTDKVQIDLRFLNPVFDYVEGYFGQTVETIKPDSLDLKIDDILNHLTGDFLVSSPSITVNYSNSFAIPMQVSLGVRGKRNTKTVDLSLAPFDITPCTFATRDVSSSFGIDKINSSLPALISLPPQSIKFSGTAKMNPSVIPSGVHPRNNYVFGNSRFLAKIEVEVPLEFRMNNLQFTDTIDNFLKDKTGSNSNIKPEDFKLLRIKLIAKNGFPMGVSVKMSLYDTTSTPPAIKSTIDATGLLNPAPVDTNGKSNGVTETTTNLEFTQAFFSSIPSANKIIFQFTLNTTNGSTQDIKIYSDYTIDYNVALVAQPDITFN